jgi:hypothetical protein
MSSGLFSGVSGLALGTGLYRDVSGLWSGASGLIAGFGGWTPAVLFAQGEQGAWYDPSDFSTLYQDNFGTTPVTATGQTVGLMLDKSQGLVLGPELVANQGPFTSTTDYAAFQGTLSTSGGNLISTATVANDTRTLTQVSTVIGKYYRITVTVASINAGAVSVGANFTTGSVIFTQSIVGSSASNGTITLLVQATNTSMNVVLRATSLAIGQSFSISAVTVKELPGNHATQSSLASRPILGREPFGGRRNLLTFTEQFDNGAWSKTGAPSAVVTPNVAVAPDGTTTADLLVANAGRIQQTVTLAATGYVLSCYMKADGGSTGELWLAGATGRATFNLSTGVVATTTSGTASITDVGDGWYRCVIAGTSAAGSQSIIIDEAGSGILIWGAQLETGSTATAYQRVTDQWDVTQAGVPEVYYVNCDGSDDFMLTGTITPGIDKAQVFAGVRKLSDADSVVVEQSVSSTTNANALALFSGFDGGQRIAYGQRGSAASRINAQSGFIPQPWTRVVTGLGDIAADSVLLRLNGTQVGSSTADQGTGNFLAYPLYIGRRGGTTLPLNGRIYSLIVRFGANLPLATIQQAEGYTNSKTGAY